MSQTMAGEREGESSAPPGADSTSSALPMVLQGFLWWAEAGMRFPEVKGELSAPLGSQSALRHPSPPDGGSTLTPTCTGGSARTPHSHRASSVSLYIPPGGSQCSGSGLQGSTSGRGWGRWCWLSSSIGAASAAPRLVPGGTAGTRWEGGTWGWHAAGPALAAR